MIELTVFCIPTVHKSKFFANSVIIIDNFDNIGGIYAVGWLGAGCRNGCGNTNHDAFRCIDA